MSIKNPHINIFIAYSRKDKAYLERLLIHLKPLQRDPNLTIWYDGEITPGAIWQNEIKTHLNEAEIILLLISADSLASDYFYEKELGQALELHKDKKIIVIPIILSACAWNHTALGELQALPKDGKSITKWGDESDAYNDIFNGIRKSIDVIKRRNRTIGEERKKNEVEIIKPFKAEHREKPSNADENIEQKAEQTSSVAINKRVKVILRSLLAVSVILLAAFGLIKITSNYTNQPAFVTNDRNERPKSRELEIRTKKYNNLVREAEFAEQIEDYKQAGKLYQQALNYIGDGAEATQGLEKIKRTKLLNEAIQDIISNMVSVEGGTFEMGCTGEQMNCNDDEKPVHTVTARDYKMGKYEVTQAQWKAVMGKNSSRFKNCEKCPVEKVSWNDTQEFIKKLNKVTEKKFRLPTETEWEFAARGGIKSKGYEYAGSNNIDVVAWYSENSYEKGIEHSDYGTHIVGSKQPNELGIYDMSGNVWEWCNNNYDKKYGDSVIINAESTSWRTPRVLRGGCWAINSKDCRVAVRLKLISSYSNDYHGFRLAQ